MEYLHVAQRRASHSREVRKKLQKEDKKDKKAQNFQTKENINKKKKEYILGRRKSGGTQQRSVLPLSFSCSFYATCPLQ